MEKGQKSLKSAPTDGQTDRRMDGWMDGRMDGWMDGRTNRWRVDGQVDGRTDLRSNPKYFLAPQTAERCKKI